MVSSGITEAAFAIHWNVRDEKPKRFQVRYEGVHGDLGLTYHARRFEINLGNSSVTMVVDGKELEVPPASQATGYTITKAAGRRPLRLGQIPTCT